MIKTNAMRLLDAAGIAYRTTEYEYDESDLSGKHAAEQIGMPPEQVFKTLVTRGDKTGILVFTSLSWTSWICAARRACPATRSWR